MAATALLVAGCALTLSGEAQDADAAARRAIAGCRGAEAIDFGCLRRRYDALVAARGPDRAVADLLVRRERSGYVRAACHQLMHVVGRAAGRRHGIRALERGDAACSSGYYHGVVEAVTGRLGEHDVLRAGAEVCAPYRRQRPRSLPHYNCAHGMGHGFMGVFSSDVRRSLEGCDTLPGRYEQEHCEGGVFMENLTAMDDPRRPSRALRPEDPLFPCTVLPRRHKGSCYAKQTAYPLFLTSGDFTAVFALCAATPDVAHRPACFRGLGGNAVVRASKYVTRDTDRRATIRALCRLGRSRAARRHCVEGAATVAVKDAATRRTGLSSLCRGFREADLRSACARAARRQAAAFPAAEAAVRTEPAATGTALCHLVVDGLQRAVRAAGWGTARARPGQDERRPQ